MRTSHIFLALMLTAAFGGQALAQAAPAKPAATKPAAAKPAAAKAAPKVVAKPAPAPEILTADALLQKADAALLKGDTDTALMLGQAAIVAESTNPKAYVALGDLYVRANQAEFARGFYDQALNLDPQDSAALAAIARLGPIEQATLPANGG